VFIGSVLDACHKLAPLLIYSGNIEGENSGKPGEVCCERCKFVFSFFEVTDLPFCATVFAREV
jgi:hypothetical protein